MAVNGMAVMQSVGACGLYIDPGTGAKKVEMVINVAYVGEDGSTGTGTPVARAGFLDLIPTIQAAIRAAIVADGAAQGFTLGLGDVVQLVEVKI